MIILLLYQMPIFTFSVKNLTQSKVYLTQLTWHILPFFTIFTGKKSGFFTEKYFTGKFTSLRLDLNFKGNGKSYRKYSSPLLQTSTFIIAMKWHKCKSYTHIMTEIYLRLIIDQHNMLFNYIYIYIYTYIYINLYSSLRVANN